MSLAVSRRRFLQISSATVLAGAAAELDPISRSAMAAARPAAPGEVKTIPTFCEMCFWRCGGIAYVRDGKLWKFEGNPLDPQSRGRLCPRGTGAVGTVNDPDRLRTPLIRVGERGKEQWKSVTWGEALDVVAQKMLKIKAEHGPESLAVFNHGIGARFIVHLAKSYGAINIGAPSFAQCRGPRDIGYLLTYGTGLGSPEPTDIENTNCLVLVGSHLGENMHNSQVQEFAKAVERRIPIIVVDPRYSVAASKAKYWLPIKPGTDLALLLAWMNVLVTEGRYDTAFVAKYGHGFDKFAAEIAKYTPEWAAAETGIDAQMIRVTARELASHRPAALVHPGRRVNWYGDDTQRSRANALLNALLGNWGRKGGLFVQAGLSVPSYPLPKYPKSDKPMADNPDGERYPFADEAVTTGIRDATISGKPYPIKGWIVYSTNLMNALPNEAETLKAIQALDLLVVIDTMPSEIAGYADVVLPENVFLERYDELLVGWGRRGWMSLRQPVVEAPAEQKPGWWIAKELAGRLGIPECMPFKDMKEYLAARVEKGRIQLREARGRGRDHGRQGAEHRRGRARAQVRHALRQGRVLVRSAGEEGLRPGTEVHEARRSARGLLPPDHGPRSGAHVQPHAVESAAHRPDARKRDLGQRRDGYPARAEDRPVREAEEPGRRRNQSHQGQGHAAHPARHRLHGLRLRPAQLDGQQRLPARRERCTDQHEVRHRPIDGRHQHSRELRHLREGGLRWRATEW